MEYPTSSVLKAMVTKMRFTRFVFSYTEDVKHNFYKRSSGDAHHRHRCCCSRIAAVRIARGHVRSLTFHEPVMLSSRQYGTFYISPMLELLLISIVLNFVTTAVP